MTTAPVAAPALAPPEERGRLELAPTVVERIAQAASGEIEGVVVQQRRGLGRADHAVRATAQIDGTVARLRMRLPLRYPVDARTVVGAVRRRVVDRVAEYADVTVRVCDIDVTALLTEPGDTTRVR